MCDGCKPHPFGNDRHTIMWFAEIVEVRDSPRERKKPEFDEIGKTVGTMLRCTRPIWNCSKVVIIDSGLCVTKGLVKLLNKVVFGAAPVKKRRYWLANIKGDAINTYFEEK